MSEKTKKAIIYHVASYSIVTIVWIMNVLLYKGIIGLTIASLQLPVIALIIYCAFRRPKEVKRYR